MHIHIPENIGSDLRLLPDGPVVATLELIILGKSKAGKPKLTLKYIVTEDMETLPEGEPTTVGETIIETVSLAENALFGLNNIYKAATGEQLPQGDYSIEEFLEHLNETLTGRDWRLFVEGQVPSDGSSDKPRTTIIAREFIG